ncbi:MAG: GntG family PLP-dependent aldolase [Planctomycetota bacterium]
MPSPSVDTQRPVDPRSVVDLRSDTVTRPSPGMRAAIAAAEVGDDVLGDDPTVLRLQARMAEFLGQEAALFVPSGSMANQVAIRSATEPGDELIIDDSTHSYNFETGGPAALSGCSVRIVPGRRGIFTPEMAEAAVRPNNVHYPRSRFIIVENTNNRGGGSIWPVENVAGLRAVADRHNLHLHMDGARLLNACVARDLRPTDYTQHVDSVSMCFSKGLGAPVGSIIAGRQPFIARCHRFRKMFGGAMRQAGILAAAALYALDHNIDRLAEDHANARRLAEAIADLPGIRLDPATVETNILIFEVDDRFGAAAATTADHAGPRAAGTAGTAASPASPPTPAADFVARLRDHNVWILPTAPHKARAVTHLDVSSAQIDHAIAAFRAVCTT